MQRSYRSALLAALIVGVSQTFAHGPAEPAGMRFIQVEAQTREQRSALANLGMSIEATRSDSVWGFVTLNELAEIKRAGHRVLGEFNYETGRGGHDTLFDFPVGDARFHNYAETTQKLQALQKAHADIARLVSIGKSIEGRDLWAIQINTTPESLTRGQSNKPGIVFTGAHHAREHVSTEIPLMLAEHLLANRRDAAVARLLDTRDIWIIPIVNPDGKEWDIATGRYRMWRKNRRNNGRNFGVDLNRNYGFKWGTGGSSTDTASDVYMGPSPFSEPETQAVRDFVTARPNLKVLLSFHTFSELILYPWGHTYDQVGNARDLAVFQKMARTMAQWNRYRPQPSSDLYIASGDTVDWAYGERGIFAFTFELSPRDMFSGGFYPGASIIDRVFSDNLRPALYLIDVADDPYKVLDQPSPRWLRNYVEPSIPSSLVWDRAAPIGG